MADRIRLASGRSAFALMAALAVGSAPAQSLPTGPDADAPAAGSALGPSPGAGSDLEGLSPPGGVLFPSRPGRAGVPPLPAALTRPVAPFRPGAPAGIVPPRRPERPAVPAFGAIDLQAAEADEGPPDGLDLDAAIERLVRANPELRTQHFEIPQAAADIVTASMRANPLIYADATAVPYGEFSPERPGGQTQYDVSITHPFDLSGKRRARTTVAGRAKQVLEAQYADAVRLQIDNLYTAFVDVLAARESLRFSAANVAGLKEILERTLEMRAAGVRTAADVGSIRIQSEGAEAAHREAVGTLRKARRNLALLLDYPVQQADSLEVRGSLRPQGPSPPPDDQLIAVALESRPDVAAYRLGVARARADVRLAQANRYSDVYVTYTPYVFQNNAPFGTKSATSWSAAITAPLPLYNRNQGSIARAKLNVDQTVSGLDRLQKEVAAQVLDADQEYHLSREAVLEVERDQFPAARDILDGARRLYLEGQQSSPEFLDARRVYNETARLYRDVLVRHRRSMLDLNTALGRRVLP